jgi:hypothetical protein
MHKGLPKGDSSTPPTKLKPEDAQRMLREKGVDITLDQAESVLSFLRMLANTDVKQYLEDNPKATDK